MERNSVYPADIDPLIFFQDISIETKEKLDTFQADMQESWSDAQTAIDTQNVSRYSADLFMMFQNRIKAVQEFVMEGLSKPDLFKYAASAPRNIEEGQSWIDIEYTPAYSGAGIYDSNGDVLKTWEELVSENSVTVEGGVLTTADNRTNIFRHAAKVIIPDDVTAIGDDAFQGCQYITSIVIPAGVTTIGSGSFYYCIALSELVLPDGLTKIGARAFTNCDGFTEFTIPSSVTTIGTNAFSDCDNLTTINYSGTATGYPWGAPNL